MNPHYDVRRAERKRRLKMLLAFRAHHEQRHAARYFHSATLWLAWRYWILEGEKWIGGPELTPMLKEQHTRKDMECLRISTERVRS